MRPRSTSTNSAPARRRSARAARRPAGRLSSHRGIASAQVATVREIVDLLVTNQSVQTGDFVKDRAAAEAASAALGQALLVSLTTLPTGASSAGFTYRFNPSLGTLERTTTNFGPSFVERAVTSGKGRVAFGTTWQYASFTRLDDRRLQDEGLVTTANRFLDEPARVRRGAAHARGAEPDRHGLRHRRRDRQARRCGGGAVRVARPRRHPHRHVPRHPRSCRPRRRHRSTGFGDVAVRAKYHFFDRGGARLAAAGEVVLPTGREEDLLGAGRSATRVMAIASIEREYVGRARELGIGLRRGLRRDHLRRRAHRRARAACHGGCGVHRAATLATSAASARSPRRTRRSPASRPSASARASWAWTS